MSPIVPTRSIATTKATGSFHCPRCGEERSFEKKRVRRFFSPFSVPLLPLRREGEYVECSECKGTFEPAVLSPEARTGEQRIDPLYQKAMRRLMIHMLLADGEVEESELFIVTAIHERLLGASISPADVEAEAAEVQASGADPLAVAKEFGPTLNDEGKESVVQAGLMVAEADGEVSVEEIDLLQGIALAMEMKDSHFRRVLASPRPI